MNIKIFIIAWVSALGVVNGSETSEDIVTKTAFADRAMQEKIIDGILSQKNLKISKVESFTIAVDDEQGQIDVKRGKPSIKIDFHVRPLTYYPANLKNEVDFPLVKKPGESFFSKDRLPGHVDSYFGMYMIRGASNYALVVVMFYGENGKGARVANVYITKKNDVTYSCYKQIDNCLVELSEVFIRNIKPFIK